MTCNSCPFSMKPMAEMALNWGCLPEPHLIMKIKRETNKNWTCHHNDKKICPGFIEQCQEENIDHIKGELASYEKWYHTGEA